MRNRAIFLLAGAAALIIAGCGGSSGSTAKTGVTRVVAGYVFVSNNNGISAGPNVIISNGTTPPPGYVVPTAGTVTLAVNDGTITRASATLNYTVDTTHNAIVATVKSVDATPAVVVSGTGFTNGAVSKGNLTATTVPLGTAADEGKVLGFAIGTPAYTPGAVASIQVLIKDNGAATPVFGAPADQVPTGLISGDTYTVAPLVSDANGVVVTGAVPVVSASNATVAVGGANPTFSLTPVTGTGAAAGAVTITTVAGGITTSFNTTFGYGTVSHVTLTPVGPTTLLWASTNVAPATQVFTATVTNQFAAPVPGATVVVTGSKITANKWQDTAASAALSAVSGPTVAAGTATVTLSAPAWLATATLAADLAIKGTTTLTATVGAVTGTATVNITRPLASVAITGPSRLDVGTTSAASAFAITNGVDVDGATVATPSGAVVWSVANTAGAGNVGDLDDHTAQSTSAATIVAGTGVVTAGAVAGHAVVSATVGGTPSNNLAVEIYGAPSKLVYTPATTVAGYSGSKTGVVFNLIDNYGHTIPTAEYTFTKSGTADSLSGAVFTNQAGRAFDITAGSGAGTFTLTVNGTWTGAAGGTGNIAKTRTTVIAP